MAPAFQWRSIIDLGPNDDALVGSFDELGNRFVPLTESYKQMVLAICARSIASHGVDFG